MGLRKLTQWEETVAKQEQKQSRLMSVAIVCVIAMCAVLWLVQDKLYGDVVRTGAAAYGCSFIGVAIGLFVRSTTGETWATSSEKRKKFEMALIGIFIVLVIEQSFWRNFDWRRYSFCVLTFRFFGFSKNGTRIAMKLACLPACLS